MKAPDFIFFPGNPGANVICKWSQRKRWWSPAGVNIRGEMGWLETWLQLRKSTLWRIENGGREHPSHSPWLTLPPSNTRTLSSSWEGTMISAATKYTGQVSRALSYAHFRNLFYEYRHLLIQNVLCLWVDDVMLVWDFGSVADSWCSGFWYFVDDLFTRGMINKDIIVIF